MFDASGACVWSRAIRTHLVPELGPLASHRAIEFKRRFPHFSLVFGEMKRSIWDGALAVWAIAYLLHALGAHAHASSNVRGLRRVLQVKGAPIKPLPQVGLAV